VLTLFPSREELEALGRAAMSIGSPESAGRALGSDAKLFARGLKRHLRPPAIAHLGSVTRMLSTEALATHFRSWSRAVDRAAARGGLLACGNVELALRLTERFPLANATSAADQGDDLLAYSVSAEYAALRERLGVQVRD